MEIFLSFSLFLEHLDYKNPTFLNSFLHFKYLFFVNFIMQAVYIFAFYFFKSFNFNKNYISHIQFWERIIRLGFWLIEILIYLSKFITYHSFIHSFIRSLTLVKFWYDAFGVSLYWIIIQTQTQVLF